MISSNNTDDKILTADGWKQKQDMATTQTVMVYVFDRFWVNGRHVQTGQTIRVDVDMLIKLKNKAILFECSCPECLDKRDTLIRDRLERATPL